MKNIINNSDLTNLKSIGINNVIINTVFDGKDIVVGNNCTIKNCIIKDKTCITDSYLEESNIGSNVSIGPYSHVRPNCSIGDNCKIGNYVEIKNSTIGANTKVNHLAYIGDAIIGKNSNIGCGVIFCNYNGVEKNISIVGDNCFVGSNSNIIAPVKIANDTYICAGTTVTKNSDSGDFVIGRVNAETKPNYSYYLKTKIKK